MLRIGLDERVEEHASALDVANLRIGFEHDTIERCEVTFGVNGCLQARSSGAGYLRRKINDRPVDGESKGSTNLVELEREDFVPSLAHLRKVRQGTIVCWRLEATSLNT